MRICYAFLLMLSGCVSVPIHVYNTDIAHIMPLREMNLQKVAVISAPKEDSEDVNSVGVRDANITAPDQSYDEYLRSALANEFIDLRLLDQNAARRITTTLLKNDVSIPMLWVGHETLQARFVVNDGKKVLFDKIKSVQRSFGYIFSGRSAFATAMEALPHAYHELIDALYADPDFIKALKTPGGV